MNLYQCSHSPLVGLHHQYLLWLHLSQPVCLKIYSYLQLLLCLYPFLPKVVHSLGWPSRSITLSPYTSKSQLVNWAMFDSRLNLDSFLPRMIHLRCTDISSINVSNAVWSMPRPRKFPHFSRLLCWKLDQNPIADSISCRSNLLVILFLVSLLSSLHSLSSNVSN